MSIGKVKFVAWSDDDELAVARILDRAKRMREDVGLDMDVLSLRMDLCATCAKVALDIHALAEADDFNFEHDVFGIMANMNRKTGNLMNCFFPRFARCE